MEPDGWPAEIEKGAAQLHDCRFFVEIGEMSRAVFESYRQRLRLVDAGCDIMH